MEYKIEMLTNDIFESLDEYKTKLEGMGQRELQHKVVVMQMLLIMASFFSDDKYDNDEVLKNGIEELINSNEILSGYMFFISHNSQFEYSWNYMRKRKVNYVEFLFCAIRFLNKLVDDICALMEVEIPKDDMHVVFNNLFDVIICSKTPQVKTNIIWENFDNIMSVNKDYRVDIKVKNTILVSGNKKGTSDIVNLLRVALNMIEKTKNNS